MGLQPAIRKKSPLVSKDINLTLETARLDLTAATAASLWAETRRRDLLSRLLSARIPRSWPPEWMVDFSARFTERLLEEPELEGWLSWYVVRRSSDLPEGGELIGSIGFLGPPDKEGALTVGYAILDSYRNCGYATEALNALAAWAFSQRRVESIQAETYTQLPASIRVLEKAGFSQVGEGSNPAALLYQLTREDWSALSVARLARGDSPASLNEPEPGNGVAEGQAE